MITGFFNHAFTIKRAGWTTDGEGNPYSAESTVGSFYGHKQQADQQLATSLGFSLTKTFSIWCESSVDIQEGDTITDGTDTFSVRAIQTNDYGSNPHLELLVEKDDI